MVVCELYLQFILVDFSPCQHLCDAFALTLNQQCSFDSALQ